MATKYIVNDLTGQTLNGDLEIVGNFSVNGITSENLVTYKALLTQTGPITATNINDLYQSFIIGETYTITIYEPSDDFSNIANVQSGVINTSGCVFVATGGTPNNWSNGSQIDSSGNLVVDVLENNLGYDLEWAQNPFGGNGYYIAFNGSIGPINNIFPRNNVFITTQVSVPFNYGPFPTITIVANTSSYMGIDEFLFIGVYDFMSSTQLDNALYYTPVTVNIKQDMTPILVQGSIVNTYPISNTSVNIFCEGTFVGSFYGTSTSNNISEIITNLNTDPETSYLGTYAENEQGGVILYMYSYLKERYCSSGTITFEVFAD